MFLAGVAGFAAAASAEPKYSRAPGNFSLVDHNDANLRVCCKRGGPDWWSTVRECRWAGGYATANKVCRKHTSDPPFRGDRLGNGNYNDPLGNPERRVCCSDGYRATWSSWRECRRIRGQDVANKVCRR